MSNGSMTSATSLADIGKRLAGGVTQKEALLKLLKAAASQLQAVQQSAGPSSTAAIKPCVQALVKPTYLNHRDRDVRLFAALCCSEALRVFAPEPPYSDPQLKDIFQLVVEIFHRLNDVQNSLFIYVVGILETLAKVKSCIVMLDLELDTLVLRMFEVFFSTISVEHPQNVHTAMLDVMATILEESEEITQELLDAVLVNLLERKKEKSPAAFGLAVSLLQRCAERLQPGVQRFFTTIIQDPLSVKSKISEEYHNVILEIYKAAPEMLVTVLPNFIEELTVDDSVRRMKAVTMLGKLFSLPEQHADQEYRNLFQEYTKRFTDKLADVRVKMLELAQAYLLNTSTAGQEHLDALDSRLMDFDEKVRLEAVKVVCAVAQAKPNKMPADLIKKAADRSRDKKVAVRRLTMAELTTVYKKYCSCLLEGRVLSEEDFEWIPSKLLRIYFDKEVKEFRQHDVDMFLDSELFPSKLPVEGRVKHWISLFSFMEEMDIASLALFFKLKLRTQQEMNKYLETRKRLKEEGGSEVQGQLQASLKAIASAFADPGKAEEHLEKLQQLKDNNIFKALATLLLPRTTYAEACACRDDLLKRIGEKHPQHEFIKHLATKISFIVFGEEHVGVVLKCIKDGSLSSNTRLLSASVRLLAEVSTYFHSLFEPFQEDLVTLLVEGDDDLKEGAARILGNVGRYIRNISAEHSRSLSEALQRLALEGTRKQAKHAVLAIAAISQDSGLKDLSVLYTRAVDSLEKDANLATKFQTLGVIAQHSLPIFETREEDIFKFVLRPVLRHRLEAATSSIEDEHSSDWDNPSKACQLQIYGVKVLVKSFLPFKETPPRARFDSLLTAIQQLVTEGVLAEELALKSSAVDKANTRLAAAKAVLGLCCRHDSYIQSHMPKLFPLTLSLAQDARVQVRRRFVEKVHLQLHAREDPLPSKFACAYALQLSDADKDIAAACKHFLAEFVESARKEAQGRQGKPSSSSDSSPVVFLPEYVLVYLVHVLAHHPSFPKASSSAQDYEPFKLQLQGFIQALDGEGKNEQDSLPLIFAIFRTIKRIAEDAVDSEKTELVFAVCDIGIMVAKDLGSKRLYSSEYSAAVPLPASLYKAPTPTAEGLPLVAEKADGSHLPKCLLDDANKQKPKASSTSLKANQAPSARGRKRGKAETGDAAVEQAEVGETAVAASVEGPSPKKARRERKLASPAAAGPTPDDVTVAKDVSPATRTTPRKRAIKTPESNHDSAGGEALVGRKIRVWWPIDKMFYSGKVQAYDSKKKQHRVQYDDGDEEKLVLAKEKWDVVDDVSADGATPEQPLAPAPTSASAALPPADLATSRLAAKAKPAAGSSRQKEGRGKADSAKRKREPETPPPPQPQLDPEQTDDAPPSKAAVLDHVPVSVSEVAVEPQVDVIGPGQPAVKAAAAVGDEAKAGDDMDVSPDAEGAVSLPVTATATDPLTNGTPQDPAQTQAASASAADTSGAQHIVAVDADHKQDIAAGTAQKEAVPHTEEVTTRRGGRVRDRKMPAGTDGKQPSDGDDEEDPSAKGKRGRPKGSGIKDKKPAPAVDEAAADPADAGSKGAEGEEKGADLLTSSDKDSRSKQQSVTEEAPRANGSSKLKPGDKEGDDKMSEIFSDGAEQVEPDPLSSQAGEGATTGDLSKEAIGTEQPVTGGEVDGKNGTATGVEHKQGEASAGAKEEDDEPLDTVRRRGRIVR